MRNMLQRFRAASPSLLDQAFPWGSVSDFLTRLDAHSLQRACRTTFADLTSPASWYVAARQQRRRVVLHLGPANSGKTYQALEVLKKAAKGVYCGPLRLLAAEVADKVNAAGIPCNLLTGQEQRKVTGAKHLACTVEMASTTRAVDVAVIDEVQMLADRHRGHAFTRALLGVPARELHVCGDPAALPLLQEILHETGEEVELREYSRLSALKVSSRSLGGLHKVRRGDCVVAFSRKQVHLLRHQIKAQGGRGCCVVYGALPPESRRQQAALFNTPRTGFNILAASDAIGMGLNLNIGRIVFATMEKFDGVETRPLTVSETKQIAGRAGRYGSKFSRGMVTTLDPEDLPFLRHAVASPSPELEAACLLPRFEQLATFAGQHPSMRFSDVLQTFAEQASLQPHYFFGSAETMHQLALMLDHLPLALPDRYTFVMAPADPKDSPVASAFLSFASRYCHRRQVPIELVSIPQIDAVCDESDLAELEALHRVYDLYIWLSWRFEAAFTGRDAATQQQQACSQLIDEGLQNLGASNRTALQSGSARQRRRQDNLPKSSRLRSEPDHDVFADSGSLQMMMATA